MPTRDEAPPPIASETGDLPDPVGKILDAVEDPIVILDAGLRVVRANRSFYRDLHLAPVGVLGGRIEELGSGPWNLPALRQLLEGSLAGKTSFNGFLVEGHLGPIGRRSILLNGRYIESTELLLVTIRDVTDRHRRKRKLERSTLRLKGKARDQVDALALLHEVTRGANEAATPEEAMEIALRAVCRWTGWEAGHAWRLAEDGSGEAVCAGVWHGAQGCDIRALARSSARMRVPPGKGIVGSILDAKKPLQAVDLSGLDDPRLAELASLGFRAVLGVPVVADGHTIAALEFFQREPAEASPLVEEVLTDIGVQIGHAKHRRRLERLVANQSEQERQRLARELHDTLGQQIVALGMMAANLTRGLRQDGSPREAAAARLVEGLDVAKQQSRALTKGLLPVEVDSTGLEVALRDLVEATQAGFPDVGFHLETRGEVGVESNYIATQLYRIAQEALYNANSHASPRNVTLSLRPVGDDRVALEIRDDGKGLPDPLPHGAGSGLRIMRHRAGLIGARLTIASVPGGGTTIRVEAPRWGSGQEGRIPEAD